MLEFCSVVSEEDFQMISDFLWSSSGLGFDKEVVNTSNAEKKQSECSDNEMQGYTSDNEDDIS